MLSETLTQIGHDVTLRSVPPYSGEARSGEILVEHVFQGRLEDHTWTETLLKPFVPSKGRVILAVSLGGAYCVYRLYGRDRAVQRYEELKTRLRSWILSKCTTTIETRSLRQKWQNSAYLVNTAQPEGHPHPVAAANRTGASRAMTSFISKLGMEEYVVSLSQRDNPEAAAHEIVQPKDFHHSPRRDEVEPTHVIKMIDVDYYVDMHYWLSHQRPVLIYTFIPDVVQYTGPEYEYCIEDSKHVRMRVRGGTTYRHGIWDYEHDYVVTRSSFFSWIVSSVDVRPIGRHRAVVCIIPQYKVDWLGWLLPMQGLDRKTYATQGEVVYNKFIKDGERMTSMSMRGSDLTVTAKSDCIEACAIRMKHAKHPVISDVERLLKKSEDARPAETAAALYEILEQTGVIKWQASHQTTTEARAEGPKRYQALPQGGLDTEDGKPIGRTVCLPLVTNPDVVPVRSYNNDLASITGRVIEQVNDVVPPAKYNAWVRDFIRQLLPTPHKGVPLESGDVIEIQDRVTQRARSLAAQPWMMADPAITLRSFMKGESYGKYSDPRNITTVGTEHTLRLSAYTYAFKKDVLVDLDWYAPGKTPRQIAERVVELCTYDRVVEGDFSRFDGRVSHWLRVHLEQAAYLRWIGQDHVLELEKLLTNEIGQQAWTSNGLPYEPKNSRLSGSPLTTDANTLINAFISYAAGREANLSHEKSWQLLGVYGGDDSLSLMKQSYLEKASKALGMVIKCETRREGDYVTFLGRVFCQPFYQSLASVQDPERTWRKLHISFAPPHVDDDQALADKAEGLLRLDPHAPITSTWCKTIKRLVSNDGHLTADAPWYARVAEIVGETWPQAEYDDAIEAISKRTGISANNLVEYDELIDDCPSIDALGGIIDNPDTVATITVAVGHDIIRAPPPSEASVATLPERVPRAPRVRVRRNRQPRGQGNLDRSRPATNSSGRPRQRREERRSVAAPPRRTR